MRKLSSKAIFNDSVMKIDKLIYAEIKLYCEISIIEYDYENKSCYEVENDKYDFIYNILKDKFINN